MRISLRASSILPDEYVAISRFCTYSFCYASVVRLLPVSLRTAISPGKLRAFSFGHLSGVGSQLGTAHINHRIVNPARWYGHARPKGENLQNPEIQTYNHLHVSCCQCYHQYDQPRLTNFIFPWIALFPVDSQQPDDRTSWTADMGFPPPPPDKYLTSSEAARRIERESEGTVDTVCGRSS